MCNHWPVYILYKHCSYRNHLYVSSFRTRYGFITDKFQELGWHMDRGQFAVTILLQVRTRLFLIIECTLYPYGFVHNKISDLILRLLIVLCFTGAGKGRDVSVCGKCQNKR